MTTTKISSSYDYIIVGAGSAGCVLANRLSADRSKQVLLIEAGKEAPWWDFRVHMPAALAHPLQGKTYNWWFDSEPEPHLNNRQVYQPRGKAVGGSSCINGMIFIRGNAEDFNGWAEADASLSEWDYEHCLPYFKKMETRVSGGNPDYRGSEGPLQVTTGKCENPLFDAFFAATQEAGHPYNPDVNGESQTGFGPFDSTIYKGQRNTVNRAYLKPVRHRDNLTVKSGCFTKKILFDGKKAIGVKTNQGDFYAKETLLCTGAVQSPQLLQVSGVGNPEHLKSIDVPVVAELPGVGENLQDHLELYVQYECKKPVSMASALKPWNQLKIGVEWYLNKTGPGASNQFEAGGFIKSNDEEKYPNLQYHFLPLAIRYDGTAPKSGHGFQAHVGPMYSDSRGHIKARTADMKDAPKLLFNYLSTDLDKQEWIEAIHKTREIFNQPAFDELRGEEWSPGAECQTDEEILDFVRREAESAYHPSGTCKMGDISTDAMAVVDKNLNVHGVEKLRVIDASIMPRITNGNLNSPVIMIAEKAADIILGK